MLLLALPLAVAVWAFGDYAAQRARNNADQRLVEKLNDASGAYRRAAVAEGRAARTLARSRRVQRLLIRGSRASVRRFERSHPNVVLAPVGASTAPHMVAVDVEVGGKAVGRVFAVPLDSRLVRRLARDSGVSWKDDRLGLLVGNTLILGGSTARVPELSHTEEPVDLGGDRVVAVPLDSGGTHAALLTLVPRSRIDAASDGARWRVVGVGLGLIAALLVLAYAVAPAIARSRLTRQQRGQAARVLEHLGDGVFVVDDEGTVRLWNSAAEAITGVRAAAVCNRSAADAVPGWPSIAAFVPVSNRPGGDEAASPAETVPVDVDGRELWLSVVAVALPGETVYAFRDATYDRRLEDLRSQFVATISHELRTPLASLHGAALTLREHGAALPAQTRDDLLAMIADQSNRLARLVEEILVAGQLDSGSFSFVAKPFDPEELVRESVMIANARLSAEAAIDVDLPQWLPNVHADRERTRQVLLNLLDNAIKYSPAGGRITVGLASTGDGLRFSVSDEGLGIPVGEQERIFEKFYRLDPDQRRGIGGTGLGLYICRELVRSMGGRIWVESEPGTSTTVAFELPVEQVAAAV